MKKPPGSAAYVPRWSDVTIPQHVSRRTMRDRTMCDSVNCTFRFGPNKSSPLLLFKPTPGASSLHVGLVPLADQSANRACAYASPPLASAGLPPSHPGFRDYD
jgi:hypothetical protein